jgi:hypothetical protein
MYKSILGVVFISLATSAHAVTLNSGETVPLFGTTAILSPETAGLILDEQVSNFTVDIDGKMVTGAVSQRLRDFGFGFVIDYRITSFDDQGLGLQIEGLNTNAFFGVGQIGPLDVDYRLDESGDVFPVTASLQFDGNPVEFDFGSNPLLAGETSRWMFVGDPNNDLVTFGGFGAQLLAVDMNGAQISIPFASYVTFIPIPAAIWLFGSGLIGLAGVARRKSHV